MEKTIKITRDDAYIVYDAMVQYIDYLKEGDEDEKKLATKANSTLNKIWQQIEGRK